MVRPEEDVETQFDAIKTDVLAFALTGARDFEISKRLRVSTGTLNAFWTHLQAKHSVTDRFGTIRAIFGEAVAATWKSKQDLEKRLREEIFDRETEQALLNQITLSTNTGGWSLELSTKRIIWTSGVNMILNRPLDAEPLSPWEVQGLVHPEDRATHRKAVERLISEGTEFHLTYRIVLDGTTKYIRSVSRANFGEDGTLIRVFGTITDETELLRLQKAEAASQRMVESIATILPETVYVYDLEADETVYSNRNIPASLGYSQMESQEMGPGITTVLLHPGDLAEFETHRQNLSTLRDGETREIEVRLKHSHGGWVFLVLRAVVFLRGPRRQVRQVLILTHDVTALRDSQSALVASEEMLERTFQDAPLGMALLTLDGAYEKVNQSYSAICGYPPEELIGQSIVLVNDAEEIEGYVDYLCGAIDNPDAPPFRREKQTIRKDGARVWVNLVCSLVRDGSGRAVRVISQIQDITGAKEAADKLNKLNEALEANQNDLEMQKIHLVEANISLTQLSITDGLTGLNNSRRSKEYLEERVKEAMRYGRPLSIAMIDVDHFKSLNDEFGHVTGDLVLQQVARLLGRTLRNTDFVGRYGGEEFLIVMPEINLAGAEIASERLRAEIEKSLAAPYSVTVSIGTATIYLGMPGGGRHLIELADNALYESKRNGRNRVTLAAGGTDETQAA